MLSSEKNIEQIAKLIEKLKRFIELKTDYLKFDAVEKLVRLLTAFVSVAFIILLGLVVLFFLSFAAAIFFCLVMYNLICSFSFSAKLLFFIILSRTSYGIVYVGNAERIFRRVPPELAVSSSKE